MVKLVQMSLKEKDTLCNPDGSDGKESHLQCRRPGFNPWVGKIPWRRAWNPLPYSCMRNPHGHRSLAGYSPWGCKGSDTTEETEHTAPGVKNPPANPEDTSLILGPGRFHMPQSN